MRWIVSCGWVVVLIFPVVGRSVSASSSSSTSLLSPALESFFQKDLLHGDCDNELESIWEQKPKIWRNVDGVSEGLFSLKDAVAGAEGGLLQHACIAKEKEALGGKWVSEYVSVGNVHQLELALRRGTIFANGAGLDYPQLAEMALLAQTTLGLPVNLNVYMTLPKKQVSVSPHTDAQNVLVFQTQGRKHWRVWAPPPRIPGKDPFGRGKNGDVLTMEELGEPLLDTWLEPGSVLYVPIGFPHATSTTTSNDDEGTGIANDDNHGINNLSCHVTLGLDTYFYGLCYCTLRSLAAARAGAQDTMDPFQLNEETHNELFSALPFGFLCPDDCKENTENDVDNYGAKWQQFVVGQLHQINQAAAKACNVEPTFLGTNDDIKETLRFLVHHWRTVINKSKYAGVVEPPKSNTLESMQAKLLRNQKNQKEEAAQKKLYALARPSPQ